MFDRNQFTELIADTLVGLDLYSDSAKNLLLGTAAQESGFGTYIRQLGTGPALGVFQMEPATEADIWENYLSYRPDLVAKIKAVTGASGPGYHLRFNLAYQIAMARVHYRRVPEPLPAATDISGLADYWKNHYNTKLGKGSVEEFKRNFAEYVDR